MRKGLVLILMLAVVFIIVVILVTFTNVRNLLPGMSIAQQSSPIRPSLATEGVATEYVVTEDVMAKAREDMVANQVEARGIDDSAILSAMRTVPRHEFVLNQDFSIIGMASLRQRLPDQPRGPNDDQHLGDDEPRR